MLEDVVAISLALTPRLSAVGEVREGRKAVLTAFREAEGLAK